jgi:hypothetical protein
MTQQSTLSRWRRCAAAAALTAALGVAPSAFAQAGLYAYPSVGQNEQQQRQDRFGKGQTGQGGVARDAAGGATLGLIGGAIAGDAGKGAAIGAVSGALFGGIRRGQRNQERAEYEAHQRAQQEQIRRQQEAQIARGTDEYRRAWSACMRARKYDVQ